MQNSPLRIAIQKSGRISEKTQKLLKNAGFQYELSPRGLTAYCSNFPLEILFLRASDIPEIVNAGIADLGIVGENTIAEKIDKYPVQNIEKLDFGKCHLSIAIPEKSQTKDKDIKDILQNTTIATSYPRILQKFLDKKSINAQIIELQGSVEIAPTLQIAQTICDLVSTGETLKMNGLKEIRQIFSSQVILCKTPREISVEKIKIFDKFLLRIQSVLQAKNSKYIIFNLPEEKLKSVQQILPGLKGPTVAKLAFPENWLSVSTVVKEAKFWDTIDKLKEAGAEGILVTPIEKIIL